MNRKTRLLTLTAIFVALYFIFSAILKVPVSAHLTLDLGYISLTVAAVYLGAFPAMTVGALGAFLESALMSQRGISPGWMLMNAVVGAACGWILHRTFNEGKKKFILSAVLTVTLSMVVGVALKTLVDCAMYSLPIAAKIPTALIALGADSAVMLLIGVPVALALKKPMKGKIDKLLGEEKKKTKNTEA